MITALIGGVIFWNRTGKEELPDVTFNRIAITANYLGASAEEMEDFVARPIENELQGIDGIEDINTTVGNGYTTVSVEFSPDIPDFNESLNEVRTAVAKADLPTDMTSDPTVRYFKTSQKPIIDIFVCITNSPRITEDQRIILQSHARNLADRLLSLPQVSDVNFSGLQNYRYIVSIDPEKLLKYQISINQITSALKNNNIRIPLGSLELQKKPSMQKTKPDIPNKARTGFFQSKDTKLTLEADLLSPQEIRNIVVRGNFEGQMIRIKDLARVYSEFEEASTLQKINGFEAIQFTISKSSSYGILEAVDEVKKTVADFQNTTLAHSPIQVLTSDDESLSIRNRLSFIASNGILGFFLVLVILFIFLNFKSGFWVAMGIPFSFTVTMIIASIMGYTINNITLAAVIIVMGMVVDDAIVVSENITRLKEKGMSEKEAVVTGTAYVLLPIIGSIVTTCIAFIPLLSFQGRMGLMVRHIPPIIFMILGASLLESILILPSHLQLHIPRKLRVILTLGTLPLIERYFAKKTQNSTKQKKEELAHWFYYVENFYERVLRKVLHHRWLLFIFFIILFVLSGYIFVTKMHYVMFPRTESTEVYITGETSKGMKKADTELKVRQIEEKIRPFVGHEVKDFITQIARGRFGVQSPENRFQMEIFLVDKEKRKKTTQQLISEWQSSITNIEGFYKLNVTSQRFGPSSGTALDIAVTGNAKERILAMYEILIFMTNDKRFVKPEIEEVMLNSEFRIHLNRDEINRLGISPLHVSEAFKTIAGGNRLYSDINDDEEIDYIVMIDTNRIQNLKEILSVPVANSAGYLVPLSQVVVIEATNTPATLARLNGKQVSMMHSDLDPKSRFSPLEAASYLEKTIFKEVMKKYPSINIQFQGEVKDSREAGDTFKMAVIMVVVMIYLILALLFNSLSRPLIIMAIIPFGLVGIILAFRLHGMLDYGFFAGIGALGLAGVVINDSIVMIDKLDKEFANQQHHDHLVHKISAISKTRLRAVMLTTLTTVAGLLPSAYGIFGYDAMLAEMMLALAWGLLFGTLITLFLVPAIYTSMKQAGDFFNTKIFAKMSGLVILGALLFVPGQGQAQSYQTNLQPLSLSQFLSKTRQNNIQFQLLALDKLKVQYDYRLQLPTDDLMISALFNINYKTANKTFYTGMGLGLSKLFATTGTELTFSYNAGPSSSPITGTTPVVTSSLSFQAAQPILANAFGLVQRLTIKKAEYVKEVTLFEIQEAYEDYLQALLLQYYSWYSLSQQKEIALQSLALIRQTRGIVLKKYQSRIADIADLNRATIQVLEQENQVKSLDNQLRKIKMELAKSMSLTNDLEYYPLYPDISFTNEIIDFRPSWEAFVTNSRTIKTARILSDQNALSVDIAKQSFIPELNATAGMSWADRSYNPFVNGGFNIGVEFAYTIPDSKDTATFEKSKIVARQSSLSLSNLMISSYMDMKVFWENLTYQKEIGETLEQKIRLMEVVVRKESESYQQGRSTLTELLTEINKLRSYRLDYLLATIELEKAYLSWNSSTDMLLSKLDDLLK